MKYEEQKEAAFRLTIELSLTHLELEHGSMKKRKKKKRMVMIMS
jgi:hypothetical protein